MVQSGHGLMKDVSSDTDLNIRNSIQYCIPLVVDFLYNV